MLKDEVRTKAYRCVLAWRRISATSLCRIEWLLDADLFFSNTADGINCFSQGRYHKQPTSIS
jgi:hypothetical protein